MAANGMVDGPESPLLEDTVAGAVDHTGLPAKRSTSGGWSSSYFIIGKQWENDLFSSTIFCLIL